MSKDRLSNYAGRFSFRLNTKMGDETADIREENTAINFVVYHTYGSETLAASMGFSESKCRDTNENIYGFIFFNNKLTSSL